MTSVDKYPKSHQLWTGLARLTSIVLGHTLLYGWPGTGKSRFAFSLAQSTGRPIGRIHMTRDSYDAEIVGHFGPNKDGGLTFIEREGLRMAKSGGVLLVDDIHNAQGSGEEIFLAMADDPEVASFNLPWGETVRPEKGFQVIATSNSMPESLADPIRDRLLCLSVNIPSPGALEALERVNASVARMVYNAYVQSQFPGTPPILSYRDGQWICRMLTAGLEMEAALGCVFHDDNQRSRVQDALEALTTAEAAV